MIRGWLRRQPRREERWFKGLREDLDGLMKQAVEGKVRQEHRADLAFWLSCLDIWPRGIRATGPEGIIAAEADYLRRCTDSCFGLNLARTKFPKHGPQEWRHRTHSQREFMGDEYQEDVIGQHYDAIKEREACQRNPR